MDSNNYVAPRVLQAILPFLDALRANFSRQFSDFVTTSKQSDEYQSYRSGLNLLVCILGVSLLVWSTILILLKLYGSAGCAAGKPFQKTNEAKTENTIVDSHNDSCDTVCNSEEGDRRSHKSSVSNSRTLSSQSSLQSGSVSIDEMDSEIKSNEQLNKNSNGDQVNIILPRERRTRVCFLTFGSLILLCIPLCACYSYIPLAQSISDTNEYVLDAQVIVDEAADAVSVISSASDKIAEHVSTMYLDIGTICPGIMDEERGTAVGIQLQGLVNLYKTNYTVISSGVSRDISLVQDFIDDSADVLSSTQKVLINAEKHLWVIPTVLILSAVSTLCSMSGVFLAWRQSVNKTIYQFYSFWMLPIMIFLSMTSWMIAMGGSVVVAISVDACLSGSQAGSPQNTIEEMLTAYGVQSTDPIYGYISAFLSKCSHSDGPSKSIEELMGQLQVLTDDMSHVLSKIDDIGKEDLNNYCTGKDSIDFFLKDTHAVTQYLADIQSGLKSLDVALTCERVNHLYDAAVNQSVCSTAASSIATGFIYFAFIGILTMVLISLRASWQQEEGDKDSNLGATEHSSSSGTFEQDNIVAQPNADILFESPATACSEMVLVECAEINFAKLSCLESQSQTTTSTGNESNESNIHHNADSTGQETKHKSGYQQAFV